MGKTVKDTHITGEFGVIHFSEYCNRHKPYIIFREVLKSDFGIDGEIELTRTNEDNKIEPTGEILKVQIKTAGTNNSYIKNEGPRRFEFHPRKEDLDYWGKYKNNGFEVLLVVVDKRTNNMYCKKVFDTDIFIAKNSLLKTGKKRNINPIVFDKEENLLKIGESNFVKKYSTLFTQRINFDTTETLIGNFLKFKSLPKQLIKYPSKYNNKKDIYEYITQDEAPFFIVKGGDVYTIEELGIEYSSFKSKILESDNKQIISFKDIIEDKILRNYFTELLNEFLKYFLGRKQLNYDKKYGRFYFRLPKEMETFVVETTTRKRGQFSQKTVVKKYEYGKVIFYRHIAVEFRYHYIEGDLFLSLIPKYYFTQDGRKVLGPDLITKFTNYLTAREFNNHYCDWLHFWWSYLTNDKEGLIIYEHPKYKTLTKIQSPSFYNKYPRIVLSNFLTFRVPFGIPLDVKERKKKPDTSIPKQPELF